MKWFSLHGSYLQVGKKHVWHEMILFICGGSKPQGLIGGEKLGFFFQYRSIGGMQDICGQDLSVYSCACVRMCFKWHRSQVGWLILWGKKLGLAMEDTEFPFLLCLWIHSSSLPHLNEWMTFCLMKNVKSEVLHCCSEWSQNLSFAFLDDLVSVERHPMGQYSIPIHYLSAPLFRKVNSKGSCHLYIWNPWNSTNWVRNRNIINT